MADLVFFAIGVRQFAATRSTTKQSAPLVQMHVTFYPVEGHARTAALGMTVSQYQFLSITKEMLVCTSTS